MQPVQDLTVEKSREPRQYQYSLEDADARELAEWAPRLVERLRGLPALRDVASDQQDGGLMASLVIDRDLASRLAILPQAIDDTLYDAFGQRQVSTIFTQLNQYHVILEVAPRFQQDPEALKSIYVKSASGAQVPLSAFTRLAPGAAPLAINHQGQFSAVTLSFNLAPGISLGHAVTAIRFAERAIGLPPSIRASFQGTAQAFQARSPMSRCSSSRAHHRVHRARRALRELHPSVTIRRPCRPPGGRHPGPVLCRMDLDIIALIGIILLISIVKKNDHDDRLRADAEREEGKPPAGPSTRPACSASAPS
jgi:multidrug efflux pump subunit AcrB